MNQGHLKQKQKQHVDFHRKILLRKNLLHIKQGVFYIPFIGDGDIAFELYRDAEIHGAYIDPARTAAAKKRLCGNIITANCDSWPFPDVDVAFDAADFDSYSEPYESFRSFWEEANKANKMTLFFTDGHKQGLMRTGHWHQPDGNKEYLENVNDRRKVFNFYFPKHIFPWFANYVKPYKVIKKQFYLRGMMLYWGAVIKNV